MSGATNGEMIGADMLVNPKNTSGDAMSTISSLSKESFDKPIKRKKSSSSSSSTISSSSSSSIDIKSVKSSSKGRKHRAYSDDDASSTISSVSSDSDDSSSVMSSISSAMNTKRLSQEEIMQMKRELLYQFDRMERKGFKVPKKFTMASSYDEMKTEYERLKMDREVDLSVKFQKKVLMTVVTGAEFFNSKFDPFSLRLDGWSESLNNDLSNFEEVLEQIAIKYRGKAQMAPELKLMFLIVGSGFMHHLSNTMFKSSFPGLEQVMKQNPDLMKQFASATMNTMANNTMSGMGVPPRAQSSGGGSGLGSIIGSLFGFGGGGGNAAPAAPPAAPRAQMRGPSNVDDILRDFQQQQGAPSVGGRSMNDRLEVMSTISESEMSDMPEDASVSGIFPSKSRSKRMSSGASTGGGRRTLEI